MKTAASLLSLLLFLSPGLLAADTTIDWTRAKELYQRSQNGEKLSPEDQKYLDEAKRQREAQEKGEGGKSTVDMTKAKELFEKKQRGETLTPEEEKYLEEAKRQREARMNGGGGGNGNGGNSPYDISKAKAILQKKQQGEPVTPEEEKYLEEAKRYFGGQKGKTPGPGQGPGQGGQGLPSNTQPSEQAKGLVPLTELTGEYHSRDGGLYGSGKNEPPATQQALATQAIAGLKPLNAEGKPDEHGKIVLMSIGMSNTTMEFSAFVRHANEDERKAPDVLIVDGAQGGQTAARWATASASPWKGAEDRLKQAGVTPQQVQVVWIKQANAGPQAGEAEIQRLQDDVQGDVVVARQKYPNLRLAFLSSRIYGGYAKTKLNPEPYAYEGAFAMRGLIQKQIGGDPALNADAAKGEIKAPVLLWGPYLWAAGPTPRKADGLTYLPADLGGDGTHPSPSGREKVAKLLLDFFTTNPNAKPWFVKKS